MSRRRRVMRRSRGWALVALLVVAMSSPALADRARYDSKKAGHPLKIAYYVLYPVGFIIDVVVLRPANWLGQREPFRTVFGVEAAPDYELVDPGTGADAVD